MFKRRNVELLSENHEHGRRVLVAAMLASSKPLSVLVIDEAGVLSALLLDRFKKIEPEAVLGAVTAAAVSFDKENRLKFLVANLELEATLDAFVDAPTWTAE